MNARPIIAGVLLLAAVVVTLSAEPEKDKRYPGTLEMNVPDIKNERSVKYDFPIVYVRAPRKEDDGKSHWAEVGDPRTMEPGADLMLLQPDGKEEVLVAVKHNESIADPAVSFDGEWVYFAKRHDARNHKGSDIYKIHVPSRKVVQ